MESDVIMFIVIVGAVVLANIYIWFTGGMQALTTSAIVSVILIVLLIIVMKIDPTYIEDNWAIVLFAGGAVALGWYTYNNSAVAAIKWDRMASNFIQISGGLGGLDTNQPDQADGEADTTNTGTAGGLFDGNTQSSSAGSLDGNNGIEGNLNKLPNNGVVGGIGGDTGHVPTGAGGVGGVGSIIGNAPGLTNVGRVGGDAAMRPPATPTRLQTNPVAIPGAETPARPMNPQTPLGAQGAATPFRTNTMAPVGAPPASPGQLAAQFTANGRGVVPTAAAMSSVPEGQPPVNKRLRDQFNGPTVDAIDARRRDIRTDR